MPARAICASSVDFTPLTPTAPTLQGMLEGGVPIVVNGQVVGAVGVSGVKSTEDAQIARAGIAALGV